MAELFGMPIFDKYDSEKRGDYHGWHHPTSAPLMSAVRPIGPIIPRAKWHERIIAQQGNSLVDFVTQQNLFAMDQNGLNYCWAYGTTRAYEISRLLTGCRHVPLAPESLAGPIVRWRNEGGYASEAFKGLESKGVCEASFLDQPHSRNPEKWKTGWQENALLHRSLNWYQIGSSFDEIISCLLCNLPVAAGLPWWGHLVCFLAPIILKDDSIGVIFQNSWGPWPSAEKPLGLGILTEKAAIPDGAATPLVSMFE